jgi:hypothetical protein
LSVVAGEVGNALAIVVKCKKMSCAGRGSSTWLLHRVRAKISLNETLYIHLKTLREVGTKKENKP